MNSFFSKFQHANPILGPALLCWALAMEKAALLVICILLTVAPRVFSLFSGDIYGRHQQDVFLWPMPANVTHGSDALVLSQSFKFVIDEQYQSCETLLEGLDRFYNLIFGQHSAVILASSDVPVLEKLRIELLSSDETLQLGIDESYQLQVPSPDDSTTALLKATNVYGALHGLQTFSQMCIFNFLSKVIEVPNTPWSIVDSPRFSYRGLLIDTSRHYQPLEVIKTVIDSMSYAKLNVLHWHIVDTESFPIEIPSFPRLWDGSYTYRERYTMDDARAIVEYARLRGINIMAELDVPGHAASWGLGYSYLWPSTNCTQPLDVSNELTFDLIEGIISDFSSVFPFKLMHLGGDEVDTSCWSKTPHIKSWLDDHSMSPFDAYEYFVLRAQGIALSHGYLPVNWEETFDTFGKELNYQTIVHNWIGKGVCPKVVEAGFRCIVSDQDVWYLDHLDVPWEKFYMNEPLTDISSIEEQELVLGGEVCMWGETVDASDIHQTIWPRAAAAAERLWSPREYTDGGSKGILRRLEFFRCLLNERGIAAAPVRELGRVSPPYPGSCYQQ